VAESRERRDDAGGATVSAVGSTDPAVPRVRTDRIERERRERLDPSAPPEERIANLEAELAAAHRTIDVLIDTVESRSAEASQADLFEVAARMEQLVEQRTREIAEQRTALEAANAELRALTDNLDQIVRSRTRALAESEAQLRAKNAELEKQGRAKAEFISIVAHELRTPLTSIVGYLELFFEGRFGGLPAAMQRPLTSLQRNANRLKRLVDEMLDVSRIDAGRVVVYPSPVDLGEVVREVVTELSPLARAKQQRVETEVAPVGELEGDRDKLTRIVINLVSNAIRYTPPGGEVSVRLDEAPRQSYPGDWVRLRVRDNGMGIAEPDRTRIFEPFTDVQPAKHHTSSGPDSAGLGLYIARGLVEAHGGLITVDSEPAVFTEFTVLLPRRYEAKR
jgi:signal transduction histidine kinase